MNINDYDVIVFDLDGTIYNGNLLIEGANDVINFFRKNNKKIFFATNNSSKTRSDIASKLNNMGVKCMESEVITSGSLALTYIKEHNLKDFYIFGSETLYKGALEVTNVVNENKARNLLIGFTKSFDYNLFSEAFRVAKKADNIILCNEDKCYPDQDGKLYPGCGYISSSIRWCSDNKNVINVGKPNTYMLEYISKASNVGAKRILCVGDSIDTDYQTSKAYGSPVIIIGNNACELSVNKIKEIISLF